MSRTVVVGRGGTGIGLPAAEAFARDGHSRHQMVPPGRPKEINGAAEHGR